MIFYSASKVTVISHKILLHQLDVHHNRAEKKRTHTPFFPNAAHPRAHIYFRCMYVFVCICMYLCMYVCIYVYVHTHIIYIRACKIERSKMNQQNLGFH